MLIRPSHLALQRSTLREPTMNVPVLVEHQGDILKWWSRPFNSEASVGGYRGRAHEHWRQDIVVPAD